MQRKPLPFILFGLLVSCGPSQSSGKTIVASFYPIYFLASQIAGNQYTVTNLTPAGSEPHDFQLTPKGRAALEDADLIFVNGLGMETWTSSLDERLSLKTHALSDGIDTLDIEGRVDPHIWLDLDNYLLMGKAVREALEEADPTHSSIYLSNYRTFSRNILTLWNACMDITREFNGKVIAVSHAAYGYLCKQHGIEQLYINGLSPDDKPQAQSLGKIMDAMRERGIDTIFFEELVSPEIAEYIASQTGAKVDSLNPLESLEQKDIDAGKDYFSVYLENMRKIAKTKP